VAIGDLDGDGRPDLAALLTFTRDITLLFGRGDGTFVRRGDNLPMGNNYCYAVALGDLDRDGKLDLVVGNGTAGIAVLLGKGDGTFGNRVTYPAGYTAYDIVLADFDGDSNLDVAEADLTWESGIYVFRGRGDGTLANASLIRMGRSPRDRRRDFNRDEDRI
jgi:hypothetical protein